MSDHAVRWASKQHPPHALDKLVLWALADAHNREKRRAYPSVAAIVAFTGWQRKAVMASLDRLARYGFIFDTGDRIGKTRQIKVWALAFDTEMVSEKDPLAPPKESLT